MRILVAALVVLAMAVTACDRRPQADASDVAQVARGSEIYDKHCASCHGAKLEGQANWKERSAAGRLPAPPHDESGHTWHHPDTLLFNMTKNGIAPYAPPGYQSDMPAFADRLSDEDIWAVLAYIKSHWRVETQKLQAQLPHHEP